MPLKKAGKQPGAIVSYRPVSLTSPEGSGQGRRRAVREGYKVVALLLKPSLGLFGLVGWRRVLLPHPGSATGHLIAPGVSDLGLVGFYGLSNHSRVFFFFLNR